MTIKQFEFRSRNGDAIRADVRFIESNTKKPVILCLHGFKGFKDWGPFPAIREKLALAGFVAVGMNFSHNGVGDDLQNFTELDRFAENTFSLEVTETEDVIGAIARAEITTSDAELPISAAEYDATRIGILGHSRGAAIGILVGSKSTLVRAVAAWAPVSKFDRYSDRQKAVWRERGYFEVKNMRTGQTMRLNASLLDDVEHHREYLDILHAAELMNSQQKEILVIAASEDVAAPQVEAQAIATSAGLRASLHVLEQTGHTFGAAHPFVGWSPALLKAEAVTEEFFVRYLITHPLTVTP